MVESITVSLKDSILHFRLDTTKKSTCTSASKFEKCWPTGANSEKNLKHTSVPAALMILDLHKLFFFFSVVDPKILVSHLEIYIRFYLFLVKINLWKK